jgi:hypothetical protein
MVDLTRPQRVVVRGSHSVWSYDRATSTLVVTLPKVAPAGAVTVTQYGGSAITAASPT